METKKGKKLDLGISLVIIIGLVAVLNFFSYQIFYRLDLTEGKIYSISKASKKTAGELADIVNIKAYFSGNLPSQLLSLRREVGDILDEYAVYSNGRIRVSFIDPDGSDEIQRELYLIGIPQLTFEVYEKDKMQLVNGYIGIAVSFGGRTEVIPAVRRDASGLEYQLTTAIKKAVSDEIAVVGFLASGAAVDFESAAGEARRKLEELYTVRGVSLNADNPVVPPDIDTLIIAGATDEFTDDELKAINDFLVRGGALLALIDGVKIEEGLQAVKNTTNLIGLLETYGIKLNQDLVGDARNGIASFTQGFVTFSSNYAFWPKITREGFNGEISAVANLDNVILPWASSLEIDNNVIGDTGAIILAETSERGWRISDNYNVLPQSANQPQGEQKKRVLAVLVNAALPNAYPDDNGPEEFAGRLIVVGDSDFITDGFARNSPENLVFFQNLVDTVSFDEDLINIRSKVASSRPIKEGLESGSIAAIRYLNVFGLTAAVVVLGLARYYLRRRSRFVDDL